MQYFQLQIPLPTRAYLIVHRPVNMKGLVLISALIALSEARLVYRTPANFSFTGRPAQGIYSDTSEFIEAAGYIAEVHKVTTEDGYIVDMQRMPTDSQLNTDKVVIILSGLAIRNDNWFVYNQTSFPVVLRKDGYDVWIVDFRGTTAQSSNVNFSQDDPRYYKFSFHEMGIYDMPAFVDYALSVTGATKLYLAGYSRGVPCALILLSIRPEYNEKIKLLVGFAPVVYLKNVRSPLIRAVKLVPRPVYKEFFERSGITHSPGSDDFGISYLLTLGASFPPTAAVEQAFLDLLSGPDTMNSQDSLKRFLAHFPGRVATQEFLHYLQLAQRDLFQLYDYGIAENQALYNSPEPPDYPLEKITAPILLYRGRNDFFVCEKDHNKLRGELPNVVQNVELENFVHFDFIYGERSDVILYNPTIEFMKQYQSS